MEYVSALVVLLHSLWRKYSSVDAFNFVERAETDFFTVFDLDFGGLLSGWKIPGQSKMQQRGSTTIEILTEVLDAAWKIGNRVKKKNRSGKLHAIGCRVGVPTRWKYCWA